ncbi:MAG: winged helix-turn-helix domain-containing protein [Pseudolabrys sp.]|nr:winged helix-turn-helix domain-containing protein [Pseudolabrys sp.]
MTAPAAFIFGPFRLVVHRRELLLHGIPVALGQRAIEILLILVSHAGQLVTKDEIMSQVWPGVIIEENNLQVHISALRKAFGSAGDSKTFLLTVAGRGYRFVAPIETESPNTTLAVAPAMPASAIPLRTSNLPQQLTSFIGRQQEIGQIAGQFQHQRLVTLTGAGGVGKTRLAVKAGWQLAAHYPDGVWLVELAPIQDPQLVVAAIAEALAIELAGGAPLAAAAVALANKHLLLILDNCEHVIGQAATVAETLLRAAPRLSILTTSRERLAIAGENVVRVPSLKMPETAASLTAAQAQDFEAVQLFVERARGMGEDWRLTDATAPAVASICRRLDGIPLAIEMAVPRLRVLSLSQLADGLKDRFRMLAEGSRTALPRHRTLEAVIDWSYALLNEQEQLLFRRLSVFAGTVGLEAITAVAARPELSETQTLDLLLSLIEKSLVVTERSNGDLRYRMLESNRDYARQKLGHDAALLLREYHADFYRARMAQATVEWETMSAAQWLDRYGPDVDEIRTALHWAFSLQGDDVLALDLVANSHVIWGELGLTADHRQWVQTALARVHDTTPKKTIARLLSWHAGDVKDIDDPTDYDDAIRAAELHAQLGNAFAEGQALLRAGSARLLPGNGEESEPLLLKAYALLKPFGASKTLARCLSALASAHLLAGDLTKARQRHEEALSISRQFNA